jgi:hypothetical protein
MMAQGSRRAAKARLAEGRFPSATGVSVRPQGLRAFALSRRLVLALSLLAPGCATSGFGKNTLVSHGDAISVPLSNGEVEPAMEALTREITHLLIQEFTQPKKTVISDPQAGTIEMSLLIPATDRTSRTFHFYIRLQIRDATAASVTIVPRIFAEMVNQKGSVQWILQGPDRDLASLVNEIQKYISNRTGA